MNSSYSQLLGMVVKVLFYRTSRPNINERARLCFFSSRRGVHCRQLHPLVLPQVSHFMQVPFRTSVKLPHS